MTPGGGARVRVRDEQPSDHAVVRRLTVAAFPTPAEADLVDRLRRRAPACVSLVGEVAERVVGHLMLSPVRLEGHSQARLMGLAPMAVVAQQQGRGVGSSLVRAALARCTATGVDGVVVLGHPTYYPRFGFVPASRFGLISDYDSPDEAFMAVATTPNGLDGRTGRVHYHAAFADLTGGDAPPASDS